MVVIGIGSNVGNREAMLDAAIISLRTVLSNMRLSSRMESEALLLPNSPSDWNKPFLNMAVSGDCNMRPRELMNFLKKTEKELGRCDRGRWSPREIDLDILIYNDFAICEDDLIIPHPELLKRDFALKPLAEIAPDVVINSKTAKEWLCKLELN